MWGGLLAAVGGIRDVARSDIAAGTVSVCAGADKGSLMRIPCRAPEGQRGNTGLLLPLACRPGAAYVPSAGDALRARARAAHSNYHIATGTLISGSLAVVTCLCYTL